MFLLLEQRQEKTTRTSSAHIWKTPQRPLLPSRHDRSPVARTARSRELSMASAAGVAATRSGMQKRSGTSVSMASAADVAATAHQSSLRRHSMSQWPLRPIRCELLSLNDHTETNSTALNTHPDFRHSRERGNPAFSCFYSEVSL